MSETKLRRNPENGAIEREVVTYEVVELAQLEEDLKANEQELADLLATKRAAFEETLNEDPEVKAARSAVADCKSEHDLYTQLVGEPESDGSSESVDSEDASESEATPVAVNVAAPEEDPEY
jgi:hypothetical protein